MRIPRFKYWLAAADLLLLLACFKASELICQHWFGKVIGLAGGLYNGLLYLLGAAFFMVIFEYNNLYKLDIVLSRVLQFLAIIRSFFYGLITLILISYILKLDFVFNSRTFLALFAAIGLAALVVCRLWVVRPLYRTLSRGKLIKSNVLIVGAGRGGQLLAEKLAMEEGWGMRVIGYVDDDPSLTDTRINGLLVLGMTRDITRVVAAKRIQEVIFAIDNIRHQRLMSMIDRCRDLGVRIKLTSELFNVIHQHLTTEKYAGISVVDLSLKFSGSSSYRFYKRLFDLLAAGAGLIVLSPLTAVIAVLVKATSPGPVIYRQQRVGRNGRIFDFYKFRSMTVSRDDDPVRRQQMIEFIRQGKKEAPRGGKIVNEQRITWIGRIIRKTSLDELPQLVNVVKGDMSLVGPRPCLPYEYEHFEDWQKQRSAVLPGCTGLWQVTGRGKVSFNDSVVLDLYYINNMSPWFDLLLILKTIPVMILAKSTK